MTNIFQRDWNHQPDIYIYMYIYIYIYTIYTYIYTIFMMSSLLTPQLLGVFISLHSDRRCWAATRWEHVWRIFQDSPFGPRQRAPFGAPFRDLWGHESWPWIAMKMYMISSYEIYIYSICIYTNIHVILIQYRYDMIWYNANMIWYNMIWYDMI